MKCVKRKVDAWSMWVRCVVDVGSIRVVVGVEEKYKKNEEEEEGGVSVKHS